MSHINVTINGRQYRMACEEGQEVRLLKLAESLETRVGELRGKFGEIGDARLTVMAARLAGAASITVSDILDRPLAKAREVGADVTLRADRDGDKLAAPRYDVCYEVSGSFAALKSCVAAVKKGGRVEIPPEALTL